MDSITITLIAVYAVIGLATAAASLWAAKGTLDERHIDGLVIGVMILAWPAFWILFAITTAGGIAYGVVSKISNFMAWLEKRGK